MGIFRFIRNIWAALVWYYKSCNLIAVTNFWLYMGPDPNRRIDAELTWRGIAKTSSILVKVERGMSLWRASGLGYWWSSHLLNTPQVQAVINAGWLISKTDFKNGAKYRPKTSWSVIKDTARSHRVSSWRLVKPTFVSASPNASKVHYPFGVTLSDADKTLLGASLGNEDAYPLAFGEFKSQAEARVRVAELLTMIRADLSDLHQREIEAGWVDHFRADLADEVSPS